MSVTPVRNVGACAADAKAFHGMASERIETITSCMSGMPGAKAGVVFGTAGHIDHGKTTLVRALTGMDTDRLAEEKKRGISIDLGFADMVLPSGDRVAIIDVPGHERFIKNMLAGAVGIDAVLLVVAADEGLKPQTRKHFRSAGCLAFATASLS